MRTFWVTFCILPIFVTTGGSSENTNITSSKELEGKDESLHHCPLTEVGPEDYELLPDGSVRLGVHNLTLDEPFYILGNGQLSICSISSSESTYTTLPNMLEGKDKSLRSCPPIHLEPEDYVLLPNNSVRLEAYNLTLDEPFYVLSNGTLSICSSDNTSATTIDPLEGKDKSLFECLTMTVPPEIYVLLPNKSAHFEEFQNFILDEPFYILRNGTLSMCHDQLPGRNQDYEVEWTTYVTLAGLVVSMVCLLLHLVAFCLVPDMRNLPGWNLASLCACLFVSYLLILLIGIDRVSEDRTTCVSIGSLAHFFLLSSFVWMSIMSCDVFASLLRATGRFRSSRTHFSKRRFGLYCLCAFGISLLFSAVAALADRLDFAPDSLRPHFEDRCWFNKKPSLVAFFAGPVLVLTCLNFLLFGASAYVIHANKRKSDQDAQQPALKRRYLMYFRLSVIMGVTWIEGIVANAAEVEWLWFIFVLFNALQGLFIFLAFTCSEKVKKYFRQKLGGSSRSSQLTNTTPTFHSYCHSVEKELDNIVVKENGDTVTVRL